MKRAAELKSLSEDHHQGLVHARRLRRAASGEGDALAETARGFLGFWQADTSGHFRKEEEVLLPVYARHGGDLAHARGLVEQPGRPELHRPGDFGSVVGGAQDERLRPRISGAKVPDQLCPEPVRQPQVDHGHVETMLRREYLPRLRQRPRLAHDAEVRLRLQRPGDALPERSIIVHEQHAGDFLPCRFRWNSPVTNDVGHLRHNPRARAGNARHRQLSPQRTYPLTHPACPHARSDLPRVEAPPVVGDIDPEPVTVRLEYDPHPAGARVAPGVRQGLLNDYWGLDRWVLPAIGVPGYPGTELRGRAGRQHSRVK